MIRTHPDVIDVGVFGRPEASVQELVTAIVVKKSESSVTEQDIVNLGTIHIFHWQNFGLLNPILKKDYDATGMSSPSLITTFSNFERKLTMGQKTHLLSMKNG